MSKINKDKIEKVEVLTSEGRKSRPIRVNVPEEDEDNPSHCKQMIVEKDFIVIVDSRDCFDRSSKVFVDLKPNDNYENTLVYSVKSIEKTPEDDTQILAKR